VWIGINISGWIRSIISLSSLPQACPDACAWCSSIWKRFSQFFFLSSSSSISSQNGSQDDLIQTASFGWMSLSCQERKRTHHKFWCALFFGGEESAPSPMENVLASLAACSSIIIISTLQEQKQKYLVTRFKYKRREKKSRRELSLKSI